jgi:hypothetical protein
VSTGRYAAIVVLGVASTLAAVVVSLAGRLGSSGAVAVIAGAVMAALNSIAAYALVAWSIARSTAWFFRAILGGMLARMTVMLAAVVAAILLLGLPRLPFVFSLLAYFVTLLAFEVAVVSRLVARAPHAAETA